LGIAIADKRVPGNESAVVEVANLRLSCRVDGKDVLLVDDVGGCTAGFTSGFRGLGETSRRRCL